jgi:hypothetical protein
VTAHPVADQYDLPLVLIDEMSEQALPGGENKTTRAVMHFGKAGDPITDR